MEGKFKVPLPDYQELIIDMNEKTCNLWGNNFTYTALVEAFTYQITLNNSPHKYEMHNFCPLFNQNKQDFI